MKQNNKYDIGEDEIRIIRPNPTHKILAVRENADC